MQSAAFDPVKSAECIRIGWDVLHDYPSHKERFTWSKPGGGGGVIFGIICGVCRPILQTLTLFQTKIVIFPFSDFRPEIMSSLLRLERKQKDFLKSIFEFALSLLLSYSFGVEKPKICSYIPVVPSKTIRDSRPKWVQPLPVFEPKRRKDPTFWACTYLYGLNKEVHPPRFNKISWT